MDKKNIKDQKAIRAANRKKILHLIMKKREVTQQEISRETGISIPTVINNINRLLKEGIIEDAGMLASSGGRRPTNLRFLPNSRYSFGVDISPEQVRVVLFNLDLEIKSDISYSIKSLKDMDAIIGHVKKRTEEILKEKRIIRKNVLGMGISLPGTVKEEKMVLEKTPNLLIKVDNIDFQKYKDFFDFPLFIENEANAAALAELYHKGIQKMQHLIFVSITTGIGCGIIIKGQLYKGKNKRAGEFGHMTVASEGRKCGCGGRDCWELYSSQRALIQDYNERAGTQIRSINRYFSLVKEKDVHALLSWNRYLDHLSVGIRNIILSNDPRCIAIGGLISRYEDYLITPLKERIFQNSSFFGRGDIEIYVSSLKADASIIGVSLLPIQKYVFNGNDK